MIQNDLASVIVVTYSSTVDSYGRPSTTESSRRTIQMATYLYS